LLDYGTLQTILNTYGCTAFDEAATEQVKKLFSRSLAVAQERFSADVLLEQAVEYTSRDYHRHQVITKNCENV
jgi:hypothetical protein